jgi:hypothetical protein
MIAVEDRDDDNQSNGAGKAKLRVLDAFRNLSKSVGSCNDNSGSVSLVRIKFKIDFNCREQQDGLETAAESLGMKKSSISGKQYLDCS